MLTILGLIAGSVIKFALSLVVAYVMAWIATGKLDEPLN